jgi:opacity protein-like surface antigen
MSRQTIVALAAIACMAATAPAAAQLQLPPARVGIGGGLTSPSGAYHADAGGEGFKAGWQGLIFLEFRRPRHAVGLRGDILIGRNPGNNQLNADSGATVTMRMFGGNLDLVYSFGHPDRGRRAYVLGGVGSYQVTRTTESVLGGPAVDRSESKLGWNAGAGVTVPFGGSAVFLEARYFSIASTFISSGAAPFVAIVAGIRFGRG